jgi:hypothetical protein
VNVFGFFSYILVPSVETFSHFKTTILLVFLKAFFCFGFYALKVFLGFLKTGKAFFALPKQSTKSLSHNKPLQHRTLRVLDRL